MRKKLLSIILTAMLIFSFVSVAPAETVEEDISPNVALLENILYGDRHFVIDTLVGDNFKTNFSTNPHALVNGIGGENTMMDNVLSQYQNENDPNYSKAYKTAIDIMEKVYNGDDYTQSIADFVTEFAADLLNTFGFSDAAAFMSDLTDSVSRAQYDIILKEVLDADYTASDGTTLSSKEVQWENLTRMNDGLKNLKTFADFFKNFASANHEDEETFERRMGYYNDYLLPYADSLESALEIFKDMHIKNNPDNEETDDDISQLIKLVKLFAIIAQYERYEVANDQLSSDIYYYAPEFFIDDDSMKIIKAGDKAISTASKALSSYMYINSIKSQSKSLAGPFLRMAKTANPILAPVLTRFGELINDSGDKNLAAYETVMHYIRDQGVVADVGKDAVDWASKKVKNGLEKYTSLSDAGLAKTAISKAYAKVMDIAGIAAWCADETMGLEDVCKKTYELKYLRTIIAQAIVTYRDELYVYLADKTDENAEAVLEDLFMIQKLRLRGETAAYKMTKSLWDSALGRLLASGTLEPDEMLLDYLDTEYQFRVDAFIGASVMPLYGSSISVNSGETLTLSYDESRGGLYGFFTKADNTMFNIAELNYRMADGVTVNGGRILIGVTSARPYISFIENNSGQVLINHCPDLTMQSYSQSGGELILGDGVCSIENLEFNGGSATSSSGGSLSCDILELNGDAESAVNIACAELLTGGGKLTGTVGLSGSSEGDVTIGTLNVNGGGAQTLSGSLKVANLAFTNTGTASIDGAINVSGTVQNANSKVRFGENTILGPGGSVIGSRYNCGLTLDGTSLTGPTAFMGMLRTLGDVSIGKLEIEGGFEQKAGRLTLTDDIAISQDASFSEVVQSGGVLYFSGDLAVPEKNNFKNVVTDGKTVQTIFGKKMNVTDFTNENPLGVRAETSIAVSGVLTSIKGRLSGGAILVDNGSFGEDKYLGDVTVASPGCELPQLINGGLTVSSNVQAPTNFEVTDRLVINSGGLWLYAKMARPCCMPGLKTPER